MSHSDSCRWLGLADGREVEDLRKSGVCGTPREVAAWLRQWQKPGADTIDLQIMDHRDLRQIELLGREPETFNYIASWLESRY